LTRLFLLFFQLSEEAERKGIRLNTHYDLSLTSSIFGDPARIGQVLLHLVSNAIKFTQSGNVELLAQRLQSGPEEDKVMFTVRDTGIGIPEDKLALLSTPFTQLDEYCPFPLRDFSLLIL